MAKPLVVTISHTLGKEGAKARLRESVGQLRSQLAAFASGIEESWQGDRMDFRFAALGQSVTGAIDVLEDAVRIQVLLPGLLSFISGRLGSRIRDQAQLLLAKK
jgi:putative polyhydroxyalkanoate system protein